MKNKKGFTLIELLTVVAILAVILLISIPIILGVLDRARKNSFKNQVLLYVEALKQQTGMALMGSGYSELKSVDSSFYAPTVDSDNKLVQVSVANLNKVMDNVALTNDTDKYFYVEYTDTGYNYYIGEGVRKEGEFSTTCEAATGNEACNSKTYNEESINLINSRIFNLVHITRNDVAASSSESGGGSVASNAPVLTISESGARATFDVTDDIAGYCITQTNNSGSCTEFTIPEEGVTSITLLGKKGTNYIFLKKTDETITDGAEFTVAGLSSETFANKNNGAAITLGNYNWHVMGQDTNNIWLLMDAGQLDNMGHCAIENNSTNNCTFNGSQYVYSWDKSLIRDYLNNTFYNNLSDEIKSSLISTEICKDPSIADTGYSYGGYTKSEIQSLSEQGASCTNGYTNDFIRLISASEYYNLSQIYSTTSYPYSFGTGIHTGYYPKVNYITRLSSNSWLYSSTFGAWWTMAVNSYRYVYDAGWVSYNGEFRGDFLGSQSLVVRPVIVLQK